VAWQKWKMGCSLSNFILFYFNFFILSFYFYPLRSFIIINIVVIIIIHIPPQPK